MVAPAAGGAPNGSQVKAEAKETLVLFVSRVAGATATVAPPPSTFTTELLQVPAFGTPVM